MFMTVSYFHDIIFITRMVIFHCNFKLNCYYTFVIKEIEISKHSILLNAFGTQRCCERYRLHHMTQHNMNLVEITCIQKYVMLYSVIVCVCVFIDAISGNSLSNKAACKYFPVIQTHFFFSLSISFFLSFPNLVEFDCVTDVMSKTTVRQRF